MVRTRFAWCDCLCSFRFNYRLIEEDRVGFVAYCICSGFSGSVPVLLNLLKQVDENI